MACVRASNSDARGKARCHRVRLPLMRRGCVMAFALLLAAMAGPALCAAGAPPSGGTRAPVVMTVNGPVSGETSDGVSAFKGMRYAAPPIGANRWRPPQPLRPWSRIQQARNYGADCAQAPFPPDAAPIRTVPSEDCLFINVWTPAATNRRAPLPVMVWIHGGGFVNGGSSPAIYSGHRFADSGVLLVSFNYRLGRFGFFAHPALISEGYGGNFGFLDQIAALRWVKANIAAFGGDPARVTLFGESAGGMSVHMLLQSPQARGLFAGAIIQSGGGRERTLPMPTLAQAAKAGNLFAPGATAAQLRALPAERVTGDLSMMTMSKPGYSGPMVDGRTIFGAPLDGIKAGLAANVPVMVGANSADGFPFVTDKAAIFESFGSDADEARRLYDPDGRTSGLRLATLTSADQMFIEPARAVARALAENGRTVFLYRFAHNGVTMGEAMGGAPHASEIPYVFNLAALRRDPRQSPSDGAVAALTHQLWVNFARTGFPSGAGTPAWRPATPADNSLFVIGSEGSGQQDDPRQATLDFVRRRAER